MKVKVKVSPFDGGSVTQIMDIQEIYINRVFLDLIQMSGPVQSISLKNIISCEIEEIKEDK